MKRIMYPSQILMVAAVINFMLSSFYHFGFIIPQNDVDAEYLALSTIILILVSIAYGEKEK